MKHEGEKWLSNGAQVFCDIKMENVALKGHLCASDIGWSSAEGCKPLKWHSDYKNVLMEGLCCQRQGNRGLGINHSGRLFRSVYRHRWDGVRFLFRVTFPPTFCHLDCLDRWQCYFPNPIVLYCGVLCWHINFTPCQLSCTESFAKISTSMTRYVWGANPHVQYPQDRQQMVDVRKQWWKGRET